MYKNVSGVLAPMLVDLPQGTILSPSDLANITSDIYGSYVLLYTATNGYGNTSVSAPLSVGAPPVATPATVPVNVSMTVGSNFTVPNVIFTANQAFNTTVSDAKLILTSYPAPRLSNIPPCFPSHPPIILGVLVLLSTRRPLRRSGRCFRVVGCGMLSRLGAMECAIVRSVRMKASEADSVLSWSLHDT